ncbi:MAG TPA: SRPBCC domain-containing protein [Burkholderiales bacterium]|nr:SRPBCC domain-containing protein [Burkholderiales bacterium]
MNARLKHENFTASFTVAQSPQAVFDAINDVRGWWSESIEGAADRVGAKFRYRHGNLHRTTQQITELVPGRKVAWRVVTSEISFAADKTEWKGTDIVFDISPKGGRTEVRMTHVGLSPALECYDACSGGWGFYFDRSLYKLITTGVGEPDKR